MLQKAGWCIEELEEEVREDYRTLQSVSGVVNFSVGVCLS